MSLGSDQRDDLSVGQDDRVQEVLDPLGRRRDGLADLFPDGLTAGEDLQGPGEHAKVPTEPVRQADEELLGAVEGPAEVVVEAALEEAVELGQGDDGKDEQV